MITAFSRPICDCNHAATVLQLDEYSKEWTEGLPWEDEGDGWQAITASDIPRITPAEEWHFKCQKCGKQDPVYWFDLDRCDSLEKALSWTVHLSGKLWFPYTAQSWRGCMSVLFPNISLNMPGKQDLGEIS